jgi:hypothetical protein
LRVCATAIILTNNYKKLFCEDRIEAFDAMESDELPKPINIKDAINFASIAWQNVTRETIRNCWMKTGILPDGFLDGLTEDSDPVEFDSIGEIQNLIGRLPLDQPMDAQEYVMIDDNLIAGIPTSRKFPRLCLGIQLEMLLQYNLV